ncbi:MAG: cytochrome P450, partial [Caulobacterales bacterium]|nr:cytochrome P450 [Caulobacterales bacterium]
GDTVVIDLRASNRNPDLFGADAEEFNPYRTVPDRMYLTGLSFGNGVHACLGRNLAAGAFTREGHAIDPANHQIGTVAKVCRALLQAGAAKDPADPGALDTTTTRETWARYPIIFDAALAVSGEGASAASHSYAPAEGRA